MRRALDALYDGAAALAALFMVRAAGDGAGCRCSGRQLHFNVPGTDAYAGYLMAAAGFLALAHTLQARRAHPRHAAAAVAARQARGTRSSCGRCRAASLLAALVAFYSLRLAWQSHAFNDISTGNDATPLWMPQLGMAVGTMILADRLRRRVGARVARPARAASERRSVAQRMSGA